MLFKRLITVVLVLTLMGFAVHAYPGVIACALVSGSVKQTVTEEQLLSAASSRIDKLFGARQANPVIVFNAPERFWPLSLNEYGSTSFLGQKTCVMIGAKGRNLDVVAHELMHAEIVHRVGYWRRLTALPVWFDEGLAMQVDFRPRYRLPQGASSTYVKTLDSSRDFFVADDQQLTNHYAAAKAEVALWVSGVGHATVYQQLERLASGVAFAAVVEEGH